MWWPRPQPLAGSIAKGEWFEGLFVRNVAIAVLILLVVVAIGVFALTRRGFSARNEPSAMETMMATSMRGWSVPAQYKQMSNPVACSEEALSEARAHWADHCATCHANNGSGESMLGKGMYPKPPDMRQAATQQQSDGELYYTIKNGVRLTGMPAFGDPGDQDKDSWKLVCLIRHLPKMSSDEERQMQKMNPKTPDEMEEEQQEEQFLNGGNPPADNNSSHHHH